jgi:hypothetical protein
MTWTRLYDPDRSPAHWTDIIRDGEYCVFILSAGGRLQRDMEGRTFAPGYESVAICPDLDEAVDLARAVVALHPVLCAEVYDHEGKSGEPLQVVYEASVRGRYEGRPYAKREAGWGLTLVSLASGFIIFDFRHNLEWMWGYIIGMKLFVIGASFLTRGLIGLWKHRA